MRVPDGIGAGRAQLRKLTALARPPGHARSRTPTRPDGTSMLKAVASAAHQPRVDEPRSPGRSCRGRRRWRGGLVEEEHAELGAVIIRRGDEAAVHPRHARAAPRTAAGRSGRAGQTAWLAGGRATVAAGQAGHTAGDDAERLTRGVVVHRGDERRALPPALTRRPPPGSRGWRPPPARAGPRARSDRPVLGGNPHRLEDRRPARRRGRRRPGAAGGGRAGASGGRRGRRPAASRSPPAHRGAARRASWPAARRPPRRERRPARR